MRDGSRSGDGVQDVRTFYGGMRGKISLRGEKFAHFGRRDTEYGIAGCGMKNIKSQVTDVTRKTNCDFNRAGSG